ncbi:steryl-sulfatase-like [Anneissia japonica]|uniref:steryl-sulfatase-like n=1 Tax=Anneissia japonica TaxID=1529436 RepID=UPI0014256884|nr:steryl-sulfatase-like [Anneissia japonica]
MATAIIFLALLFCGAHRVLAEAFEPVKTGKVDDRPPNVVMFLLDDTGLGDLGCYGNKSVKTPNIDKISREGMKFNRMYANPYCSPSRAAILTGRLPPRTGILKGRILQWQVFVSSASNGGLHHDELTMAEVFKENGYDTRLLGKWHIGDGPGGKYLPMTHGFDYWVGTPLTHAYTCGATYGGQWTLQNLFYPFFEFFGFFVVLALGIPTLKLVGLVDMSGMFKLVKAYCVFYVLVFLYIATMTLTNPRSCILYRNNKIIQQPYYTDNLTLEYTREAVDYLEERGKERSKPFFLMMSYNQMHTTVFASHTFKNTGGLGLYSDALREMDWSVGKVMAELKRHKLDDNLLVMLTSDNGPLSTYEPHTQAHVPVDQGGSAGEVTNSKGERVRLKGFKSTNWEGGIRVPGIIRWPGKIPGGIEVDSVTSIMDFFPTVLDIMKRPVRDRIIDGRSLLPFIENANRPTQHNFLFHWCDPDHPAAVTYKNYKAIFVDETIHVGCNRNFRSEPLLFDMANDPGESKPLTLDKYQDVLEEIRVAIRFHMQSLNQNYITEMEKIFVPWWFPCQNFPYCSVTPKPGYYAKLGI